jgi:predicted XRE-type DNA-binding protein
MEEIWKDVVGYEGFYQISNTGRLKRILKLRKYRDYNSKILSPVKDKDGYYRTSIVCENKKRKTVIIHRLVAESFINNPLNKKCVNHINGIKDDNRVNNLEWATVLENNLHAIKTGLKKSLSGEKHNLVKINGDQVNSIRSEWSTGNFKQKEIALKYGLQQSQISRIVNYVRWK